MKIVIVDYGLGNLASIKNMLERVGSSAVVSKAKEDLESADKIILPGVGAFDFGMKMLNDSGTVPILHSCVYEKKIPLLGICLGAQLLTEGSEEGSCKGLGFLKAKTVKFKFSGENAHLKVPHMGWNSVKVRKPSGLFQDSEEFNKYYFVHSFHFDEVEPGTILTETTYGYSFVSGIQSECVAALQFHPEKSHKYGMKLMENFVEHFNG